MINAQHTTIASSESTAPKRSGIKVFPGKTDTKGFFTESKVSSVWQSHENFSSKANSSRYLKESKEPFFTRECSNKGQKGIKCFPKLKELSLASSDLKTLRNADPSIYLTKSCKRTNGIFISSCRVFPAPKTQIVPSSKN